MEAEEEQEVWNQQLQWLAEWVEDTVNSIIDREKGTCRVIWRWDLANHGRKKINADFTVLVSPKEVGLCVGRDHVNESAIRTLLISQLPEAYITLAIRAL